MSTQRTLSLPLGVVIARTAVDSPWEDHVWRAASVFLHAPEVTEWRELQRSATTTLYHAATLPLELHAKETAGYLANLESAQPSVYVILRRTPDGPQPVDAAILTASPHDAEAYGHVEEEQVAAVPMPEPLVELLAEFVAAHHAEDVFVKRQRQRHHREEEHTFGQEPLSELRARIAARRASGGDHES